MDFQSGIHDNRKSQNTFSIKDASLSNNQKINGNGSIKSLDELREEILTTDDNNKKRGLNDVLLKLQSGCEGLRKKYGKDVDPIQFIIKLYYEDGMSLRDIIPLLSEIGIKYNDSSGLRNLLTKILKFEIRKHNLEKTKRTRIKRISKMEKLKSARKNEVERLQAEFMSWFLKNSTQYNVENFDNSHYNGIKSKILRIRYILDVVYGINEESLQHLKNSGTGNTTIKKGILEYVNNFLREIGIEEIKLSESEINKLFLQDSDLNPSIDGEINYDKIGIIKTLAELLELIKKEKSKNLKTRLEKIYKNLIILGKKLEEKYGRGIDPISYFFDLYFKEGLSVKDIFNEVNTIYKLYESHSGLTRLFRNIFSWDLREKAPTTKGKELLISQERSDLRKKGLSEKEVLLSTWYNKNLVNKKNPDFYSSIYETRKSKIDKAIYLLEVFYGLGENAINDLKILPLGNKIKIKFLNELLDKIFFVNEKITPIKLNTPDLSKM